MRSYFKLWQVGSVFTVEEPEQYDFIWASLIPHKGLWVAMLNYNYNTYISGFSLSNDPNSGVPLASINLGSFLQFEDYSLHPPD